VPVSADSVLARALEPTIQTGGWLIVFVTSQSSKVWKPLSQDDVAGKKVDAWIRENALTLSVDVDADVELAKALKVRAIPTLIAFQGGQERERLRGLPKVGATASNSFRAQVAELCMSLRAAGRTNEAKQVVEDEARRLDPRRRCESP
jgi:hypothetical protein